MGAGDFDMLCYMRMFCLVVILSAFSGKVLADDIHSMLNNQIIKYLAAFDRCEKAALQRSLPEQAVIDTLMEVDDHTQLSFLLAVSFKARSKCERPELTELSYTILLAKQLDLKPKTLELIESIEGLAYSTEALRFYRIYSELPEAFIIQMEQFEYFKTPFDERAILESIEKTKEGK
ncbi:hypothetical protein [Alkalimonas amylolytica]|uniref:Uncharacterized protein n=1 Tax=Alkalimonas amylolytica TaxID=152573 RepID=A0A1H4G421_ALKAM|nr:hypothetical protein [Alkalimonas amylolytica]SEB04157.1 hypothetical protein SAMN04488051_1187 [Alkalimonas amylolytica]